MSSEIACKFICTLLVIWSNSREGYAQDFGYNGRLGPEYWGERYSSCIGKHQSPIDISEHNVNLVNLEPLNFINFNVTPANVTITNNGHTVMMKINNKEMPEMSGGPLKGTYRFVQLHFHWGENDNEGSENTINNSSFPMELHLVFYKTLYDSVEEAMQNRDGLTVLSYLYQLSETNNTKYDSLLSVFPHVENPGTTVSVPEPPALKSLLVDDCKQYFTYDGSLTTPPCSEVVTWIEFKNAIVLSHDQLNLFRELNTEEGKMTHNFRPTQPLYDRQIYYNVGDSINELGDENA
ncbi:Carbonic anhydrase 2 [Carabus blaptoides fortunei]